MKYRSKAGSNGGSSERRGNNPGKTGSKASARSHPKPPASSATAPPRILRRLRLESGLEANCLVIVEGSAGSGKSELVLSVAGHSSRRQLIIRFDPSEDGFAQLAGALPRGLRIAMPAPGPGMAAALRECIIRKMKADPRGWNIVLEDFDRSGADPKLVAFIESLVADLPKKCTLFIVSRGRTELRPRGIESRVARVTQKMLRFTPEEISELLAGAPGAEAIYEITEGLAAAVAICVRYLEAAPERMVDDLVMNKGAHPEIARFMAAAVRDLEPELSRFAVLCSVLTRLTPSLCNHAFGIGNSGALLDSLYNRQVFTDLIEGRDDPGRARPVSGPAADDAWGALPSQAGDETASGFDPVAPPIVSTRNEPVYRMHGGFREFLHTRVDAVAPPEEIRKMLLRAGRMLEAEGAWAEAAVCLAEGRDVADMLILLETQGEAIIDQGGAGMLISVFERLGTEAIDGLWWAMAVLARAYETRGRLVEADALYTRTLGFVREEPKRIEVFCACARIKAIRGIYAESEALYKSLFSEFGPLPPAVLADAVLNLACVLSKLGRLTEAEQRVQEAENLYTCQGDREGIASVKVYKAAVLHQPRGETGQAAAEAECALGMFQAARKTRQACMSASVLALALAEAGQEQRARAIAERAHRQARTLGIIAMEGLCERALAICALIRDPADPVEARRRSERAIRIGDALEDVDLRVHPRLLLADMEIAAGCLQDARLHAEQALEIARKSGAKVAEAVSLMTLGMCATATRSGTARKSGSGPSKRAPKAPVDDLEDRPDLRKAEAMLREAEAHRHLHRLYTLRVEAGEVAPSEMPALLLELLDGVRRYGHESLFLGHERQRGIAVLEEAVRLGVCAEYAASLLARIGTPGVESTDGPLQLNIRMIGPLLVSIGERELRWEDWQSERARTLFCMLGLERFGWVRDGLLIERLRICAGQRRRIPDPFDEDADVDPEEVPFGAGDADRKAAHNLHEATRLARGIIERSGGTGLPAVIERDGKRLRINPGRVGYSDVEEWDRLYRRIVELRQEERSGGRSEGALPELLLRLIDLYRGDFLQELDCDDLLEPVRQGYRDRWLRAIGTLLRIRTEQARWDDVIDLALKGLARVPTRESFHYRLISALLQTGRSRDALDAYARYEKIAHEEEDEPPSPRIRKLIAGVRKAGGAGEGNSGKG